MLYKELGATGKKVSAIGFGGMRFDPGAYLKGDYDSPAAVALRAYELGVNYFDTAPGYCDDHSERIIGHALKQMPQKPYVSTKCGLWMAQTAGEARRCLEKSLKQLGLDKVTFYNLWCLKSMDDYRRITKKGGVYDGMVRARDEGLIEHICCTVHADGKTISAIINDGLADAVMLGYNALNFAYRREGIAACYEKGVGTVVMNPLGGGVIPAHPKLFDFIKTDSNQSIAEAALRFLIGQREVSVALPGMGTIREAEENCAAAENVAPVTQGALDRMAARLTKELDTLCTSCAYCDECPEGVPVVQLMDTYNEYMLAGNSPDAARERLAMHWSLSAKAAKPCTRCGVCEKLCTQKLPIIERLGLFDRL